VPAPDSAGVNPASDIRIAFSEDMKHARMERQVSFSPDVVIAKAGWDGNTLVLRPLGGLRRDTTYVVTLKSGFQDSHGVAAKTDYHFAFATAAHIDSGSVAGAVLFHREPTRRALVFAYMLPVDSGFVAGSTRPDRQSYTDEDGHYRVDYLPSNDRRVLVWAFEDRNNNQIYDPNEDVGLAPPDTVVLTAEQAHARGVNLVIVDPDEPAQVRGRVNNQSGIDTLAVSVALYADSVTAPAYYTRCDTTGSYTFTSVHAGDYELRAFVDVRADSVCGTYLCGPDSARCEEPCAVHPDRVTLEPGDTRVMSPLTLGPARREGGAP